VSRSVSCPCADGTRERSTLAPITPLPDDQALVVAARAGDRPALDALLARHYDRIHAVCRRITGNDADAQDATQEALIALVRGLPRYDGRAAFTTWSYRIAVNASLDELRRRRRRAHDPLPDTAVPVDDRPGVAATVADRIDIDAAIAGLPVDFRTAVVLRDLAGLDYAEIAEVLDVPIGTVRSRIARARSRLAAVLAGNPEATDRRPRTQP